MNRLYNVGGVQTAAFRSLCKHARYTLLTLLSLLGVTGTWAQTQEDVPSTWKNVTFNENVRYSQWVINSRIRDFYANTKQMGFNTYDTQGRKLEDAAGVSNLKFDYVPGLVAKAILEAQAYYNSFDWSKSWFYSVQDYATNYTYSLHDSNKSKITLDNMNACKMYFPLMSSALADETVKSKGQTAINNVISEMSFYNTNYIIGGSKSGITKETATARGVYGGWFHKPEYVDQMWCDGLYMGPALLAQIINYKKTTTNVDGASDWDLVTKQFTIAWKQLYNQENGLLYHAFTANPGDASSSAWAGISNTVGSEVFHSAAFWGRACGWYFLALVDVLEQMKVAKLDATANYKTLSGYLNSLAAGLKNYQDATGCWYQILDEKDAALTGNYLESSCTAIFAAAYLKAIRLGLFTTDYTDVAKKAYEGAVNQFMKYDTNSTVQLVHNCKSAGLGGSHNRSGSREYYITGNDVGQSNDYTEGKVLGAFILAATEYERAYNTGNAIRFSYDLAPSYDLAAGESVSIEATGAGEGNVSYQWYKSDNTPVAGATSAKFVPTVSGSYYCQATADGTTIKSSTTAVTVEGGGTSTPEITISSNQLADASYTVGDNATALSLTASASNDSQCSYQWYSCDDAGKTNSKAISGATEAAYTPSTTTAGTRYYYCTVSAEGCNPISSDVVKVTVTAATTTPGTTPVATFNAPTENTEKWVNAEGKTDIYISSTAGISIKKGGVKLSSTEKGGLLTINIPAGITVSSIKMIAADMSGDPTTVTIGTETWTMEDGKSGQDQENTYTFTNVHGPTTLDITTTPKEINIKSIKVFGPDTSSPAKKKTLVLKFNPASVELTADNIDGYSSPVLEAYEAVDGGTETKLETLPDNIIYMSDDESAATVSNGENNTAKGTVSLTANGVGDVKIYAMFEGNDEYEKAEAEYKLTVKRGLYSAPISADATNKTPGPDINTPWFITETENGVEQNIVRMCFGGWKYNDGTYTPAPDEASRTDSWKGGSTNGKIEPIDGYSAYVSGTQDAMDESMKMSTEKIYGEKRRGWFMPSEEVVENGKILSNPFTLPVRGSFMTFEAAKNGTLTVYILQNGAWNKDKTDSQKINPGEFRPHSFFVVNQRGRHVADISKDGVTVTTKQKVLDGYSCEFETDTDLSTKTTFAPNSTNIADWEEFCKNFSSDEQERIKNSWKSGVKGAQKIVKLDNGSYLAIQEGIVKYKFHVTQNETYYFFSNMSKMGFCGANFIPDAGQPVTDELTLSDTEAYTAPADTKQYKSVTLNRTFKKDQWHSLTLPFRITQRGVEKIFGKGTQIILFDGAESTDDGTLKLNFIYHEIQNILPGYPYLIRPTLDYSTETEAAGAASGDISTPSCTLSEDRQYITSFTVVGKTITPRIDPVVITKNKYTAMGTEGYSTADVTAVNDKNEQFPGYSEHYKEGDIFISDGDGKLYISKGYSYGKGYRSYIRKDSATPAAKRIEMSYYGVEDGGIGDTPTEITFAELAPGTVKAMGFTGVYNLNGQKVAETTDSLPAGIYVVNGQKYVVK